MSDSRPFRRPSPMTRTLREKTKLDWLDRADALGMTGMKSIAYSAATHRSYVVEACSDFALADQYSVWVEQTALAHGVPLSEVARYVRDHEARLTPAAKRRRDTENT